MQIKLELPKDYKKGNKDIIVANINKNVKVLSKCKSESFFNNLQVDSEGLNKLEKHVEILAIVFDLASLENHVGNRTESVLIRADTVICTKDIRIHYELKIQAREVVLEKDVEMVLSKEDFLKNVDLDNFEDDNLIFCHNCFNLIKSSKRVTPSLSSAFNSKILPEPLRSQSMLKSPVK